MGPICSPETSVLNDLTVRNNQEDRITEAKIMPPKYH
jgi:hypothetical protein